MSDYVKRLKLLIYCQIINITFGQKDDNIVLES